MKKIWRKNFEIQRGSLFLAQSILEVINNFQVRALGKKYIKEVIWVNIGVDNTGTYMPKNQLRGLIDETMKKIIARPNDMIAQHKKNTAYANQLFALLKKTQATKLYKLNDHQLYRIYRKASRLSILTHGTAICTTWFVDSDGEDLSNYLINYIKNLVEENQSKLNFAEAFSILTTPDKYSPTQVETIEALEIIKLIKKDKATYKLFISKDTAQIEKGLHQIKRALKNKIIRHYEKWHYTPFTYIGPAYDLNYYLEVWSGLLKQRVNISQELKLLRGINGKTKIAKDRIYHQLNIDSQHRKIFEFAADIVWLKAYRKDAMFYSYYIIDKLNREIGRRLSLSIGQVRSILLREIEDALLRRKFSVQQLNERAKAAVVFLKNGKISTSTGKKMSAFLLKQNFEKIKTTNIKELKGTPACPGRVKGIVKIINVPEEMIKMNKGDIMVAHTTFPALVPAMNKAAAIVTDDGGLTCHAAIVARELKKPCVVGTKIATKVLKDGDKIEVDATNGIVRKI